MKIVFILLFGLIFISPQASAAQTQNQESLDQAKQDYRTFLEELKKLNVQYKEITGEVVKVLREEGVPSLDENTGELTMQPYTDVRNLDNEIIVKADLPGVKKEAIKVSVRDNRFLRIHGEKTDEKTGQSQPFERVIELPEPVKDKGTQARYENGVLTVTIPKAAKPKKEISIPVL